MHNKARRFLFACIFSCFLATSLWAVQEKSAGLEVLLDEALKNNPDIQAARNGIEAAKALKPQAWGLEDPMLQLENDNARNNPFDAEHADQNRIGFIQNIPFPAKLFGRAEAARQQFAMAQAKYDQTVNDVLRDVKKAYSDLFLALRTKTLLEESRQALETFRDVTSRKYSVGKASQADVLGAEVEVGKVLNEITAQEAKAIIAQATLKALLNRSDQEDLSLPEFSDIKQVHAGLNDLVQRSVKVNPSVRGMEAEVQKSQVTLALAKLEYAPNLQIQAQFRQVDGGPDVWDGFLGVSVPLWMWKQQGMIAEAKALLNQKRDALNTEKNKTILAVRDAYARVQSAWHILDNLKVVIIPQAEQTLKVSETAYENDKIDFLTLVSYWKLLLNYRMDLEQAVAEYEVAVADLERAVGLATAQGLGL